MLKSPHALIRTLTFALSITLVGANIFSNPPVTLAQDDGDLFGLRASRAFNELEPLREFYKWKDWSDRSESALASGQAVPAPPNTTWGAEEVMKRVERIKQVIAEIQATLEVPDHTPRTGDTEQGLRNHQRLQELQQQRLQARREHLANIQAMLSEASATSSRMGRIMDDARSRGRIPIDLGAHVQAAIADLSINIPNAIGTAMRQASERQTELGRIYREREAKNQEFDRKVDEYLKSRESRGHRGGVRDRGNGVAGENKPNMGGEHRGGGSGEDRE